MMQGKLDLTPTHAVLSASSAHRWLKCPASIKASEGIEDTSSPAAEEGTAGHELAEQCLREGIDPDHLLGEMFNGYEVTREMASMVSVYVDYCRSLPKERVYIERRLDYSMWAEGGFGTADYLAIAYRGGEAHLVDLKMGRTPVAADCDQLKCYALGVHNEFGFDAQIDTYHMTIVQPRLNSIETHTMRGKDLLRWGKDVLIPGAEAALSDKAEYAPGESQCRFCKAADRCRALSDHVHQQVGSFKDLTKPDELTTSEVADVLPQLNLIKSWCDKVAKYAEQLAMNGEEIDGYKLVEARTIRRWSDEDEAMRVMGSLTNEPVYSRKPISPTKALAMLGDECDDVNALITKPKGQATLVKNSDRRSAMEIDHGFQVIED